MKHNCTVTQTARALLISEMLLVITNAFSLKTKQTTKSSQECQLSIQPCDSAVHQEYTESKTFENHDNNRTDLILQ